MRQVGNTRKEKDMITKVFGEKNANEIYHDRIAAYVVLVDNDKIAVIKTASGKFFLPGGKIEKDESEEECVIRECIEEMGIEVVVKQYFAIGERYFYHEASGKYSHAIGHFFFSDEFKKVCEPIEEDEELLWLSYEKAIEGFYHPHHRWAVEYVWNINEKGNL